MTVYVDDARRWTLGGVRTSHMAADSLEELHAFAAILGIGRHCFHEHRARPHYDVNETQRRLAVAAGAVEVRPRELLAVAEGATLRACSKSSTPATYAASETGEC